MAFYRCGSSGGTALSKRYYATLDASSTGTYTLGTAITLTNPFMSCDYLIETSSASTLECTITTSQTPSAWSHKMIGFKNGVASAIQEKTTRIATFDISGYDMVFLREYIPAYWTFTNSIKLT